MALPTYDDIYRYYVTDKTWDDRMLKTALICKRITNEQYNDLIEARKASEAEEKEPESITDTSSDDSTVTPKSGKKSSKRASS